MRYYKARISGRLVARLFVNGRYYLGEPLTEVKELEIAEGVPEGSSLIMVKMDSPDILDLLFVSEEEGEVPEAVDIWSFATEIMPQITEIHRTDD
jgi:hypothetical protein